MLEIITMKKAFVFLLFPIFCCSQTTQEFDDIVSQYGNTFDSLEEKVNKKNYEKQIDFGLESRVYDFPDFNVLVYERDESKTITEFSFLSKKGLENKESWYNICKVLNQDPSAKMVDSFISSIEDDINLKKITFNNIIDILRKQRDTSDYIYYIVYKKNNIYYQMNVFKNQTMYKVNKDYKATK